MAKVQRHKSYKSQYGKLLVRYKEADKAKAERLEDTIGVLNIATVVRIFTIINIYELQLQIYSI